MTAMPASVVGTDSGPACGCGGTVYAYTAQPARRQNVRATCIGCHRLYTFAALDCTSARSIRLAHERAAAYGTMYAPTYQRRIIEADGTVRHVEMTREDYEATHGDFRADRGAWPSVLTLCPVTGATMTAPVRFVPGPVRIGDYAARVTP